MKLHDVKIIHTEIDVPITYNKYETNIENVFILDSKNNNINGITYSCPIYFDKKIIQNKLLNNKIIFLSNGFLFYSFMYQTAFGHFIEQLLPKINYYLKFKNEITDLKMCIPKKRYNLITKNIIKLLNISDKDIIIIEHDTVINIKHLYYNNYECSDYNTDKISTFNLIREKLLITDNILHNKNVYLKKNTNIIINNDCYNIGKTRQIINENLLINKLKKLNFKIVTLGDKNIYEKKDILSNINILITQTGGNMYNLIFSNTPKHIIFLSNKYPLHTKYINNLLPMLNYYTKNSIKIFEHESYIKNCDKKNVMNDPFNVDIDKLLNYINDKI